MNKKEKAYLEKIYRDCLKLKRQKLLTEYGAGQGDFVIALLKKKKREFRA